MKDVVSLISLSAHLSLIYRKATDFYVLILFAATLLKVFFSCRDFLVKGFLGSFMYTIMSSANKDT